MVMIAADTNVWARAYLNDDAAQALKARSALADARARGGVFVPLIVLAELSWILRRKWEREQVLNAIENLLHTNGVVVESPALVLNAIQASRIGPVGFADHLIAQHSFAFGANEVITFDKSFGRLPRIRRLK
jgi:predicted nucleic-acid-binding protein